MHGLCGTQTNKSSCLSVADEILDEMEQTSIVVEIKLLPSAGFTGSDFGKQREVSLLEIWPNIVFLFLSL